MKKVGVSVHILEPGCTDLIQLVDCGVGRAWKQKVSEVVDNWMLASPDRISLWVDGFSASEKRILMTKWAAEAWELVCRTFDFEAASRRCGLLQTLDASVALQPQGYAAPIVFTEEDRAAVLPLDERRAARRQAVAAQRPVTVTVEPEGGAGGVGPRTEGVTTEPSPAKRPRGRPRKKQEGTAAAEPPVISSRAALLVLSGLSAELVAAAQYTPPVEVGAAVESPPAGVEGATEEKGAHLKFTVYYLRMSVTVSML